MGAHHDCHCQPSHLNSNFQARTISILQETEESTESSQLCQQERHQQQQQPASSVTVNCGMELELGLAPPSARHPIPMTIDHGHGHLAAADDELSSASSDHHRRPCAAPARAGKRAFVEAFQVQAAEATTTATLPLFDDGSSCGGRNGGSSSKRPLVGWPPVSSARSRACGGVGAKYVKVKKEGDAIGRKVDLSLHASYGELLATLARMFPTNSNNEDDKEISSSTSSSHVDVVVTYEDGEGDWMLVGDVPWDDFARSVKRLKILG